MSKESAYFKTENLNGKHDVKQIKKELGSIPGVISASVNLENNRIAVDFDNSGVKHTQIEDKLKKLGLQITADSNQVHIM